MISTTLHRKIADMLTHCLQPLQVFAYVGADVTCWIRQNGGGCMSVGILSIDHTLLHHCLFRRPNTLLCDGTPAGDRLGYYSYITCSLSAAKG